MKSGQPPNISRRGFLAGIAALGALSALPKVAVAEELPTLWADGIHDDAPALNALFARQPLIRGGEFFQAAEAGPVVLDGGTYLLRDTVRIVGGRGIEIYNVIFQAGEGFAGPVLEMTSTERFSLQNSLL